MPPVSAFPPSTSNNYGTVSGIEAASGLDTALSGPWMIEEQRMKITYFRMPNFGNTTHSLSLSGPTRAITVKGTLMTQLVNASYKVSKSYDIFDTSAWTQKQTFQINAASADYLENTYGDVGPSALGPAGSINTKQKWYFRREWDNDIDAEITEKCEGTNHYFYNSDSSGTLYEDGLSYWGDYKHSRPGSWQADTFLSNSDYDLHRSWEYYIPGPYGTDQEDPQQVQEYITRCGTNVMHTQFYGLDTDFTLGSSGFPIRTQGCPKYRTNRHTYA